MVTEINSTNFETDVLKSELPVLADFWAPWCGPCKMMSPVIEEAQKKFDGKLKVVKINTDQNESIAMKYQITGIPTIIFFKNGLVEDQITGFIPQNVLFEKINTILQ
jgi:thioredoxin 1